MKYCLYCGKMNNESDIKCINCGNELKNINIQKKIENNDVNINKSDNKENKKEKIVINLLLIFDILTLVTQFLPFYIIALFLVLYIRISYPENKRGKIYMYFYIFDIVIYLIILIIIIIIGQNLSGFM